MDNKTQYRRFRRLADYIRKQGPLNFKQTSFFCGSVSGIAGHCAKMLGWKPVEEYCRGFHYGIVVRNGKRSDASQVAQRYLGLSWEQADSLFSGRAKWQSSDEAVRRLRQLARNCKRRLDPNYDYECD